MLTNNRKIMISTGGSRKASFWSKQELFWADFVEKLRIPSRSTETLLEYLRLPKVKQDDLKDVGGFVGGELRDGKRKAVNVLSRDLVTLDLDNLPQNSTHNILQRIEGLGCAYAVYSTRKHEEFKPRLRVILPLDRSVSSDEYEPIARKLAELIGIEFADPTTFEASRLMYWPSCSKDSQYIFQVGDKPFCSADGILHLYPNWRDVRSWPQVPGQDQVQQKALTKQQDPEEKQGVIGAFCKTYDVIRVMDELIPGRYEPLDSFDGRYSYKEGSTVGGAVIYNDGKFLFSHHSTDPGCGRLMNAFDLFRIHKFGDMDEGAKDGTPVNKLPSYGAACEFALSIDEIKLMVLKEKSESALSAFAGVSVSPDYDPNWELKLVTNKEGVPDKTIDNICIILENHPVLRGKIAYDEFAVRGLVLGSLPWNLDEKERYWSDVDDAGIQWFLEKTYNLTGKDKIMSALMLTSAKQTFNPVQEYIKGEAWDGVPRLDTIFIDYLGANDTPYVRAVTRKSIVAMIARAMTPGVKHDEMTVLIGAQGIGKSTMLACLGHKWYSDSLTQFEGKEAAELIQGIWVNEVGEMQAMSRSSTNAVKQFLSKREDIYREPYGRRTNSYPRRGVFFGTTNDYEFLKDLTGNRRFNPIDVGLQKPTKNIFDEFPNLVRQVIAEAYTRWQLGETLHLPKELEEAAKLEREAHREQNAKEGLIREFLERKVPRNWNTYAIHQRRGYWGNPSEKAEDLIPRDRICALEIWCECLNGDPKYMRKTDAAEINGILGSFPEWERQKSGIRFGPYGNQRGFLCKHST